jgi:8-oxo-dGTP diphosphatase
MPEATVAGIVTSLFNGAQQILLTRRAFGVYKDYWCLPGGHIEPDEKACDAVMREVKEETGLDFTAQFFAIFDEIIPEKAIHAVVCVYRGAGTGQLALELAEVSESGWYTPEEALALPLAFDHHSILQAYAGSLSQTNK